MCIRVREKGEAEGEREEGRRVSECMCVCCGDQVFFWVKANLHTLKALCHAISADCLQIEAARAHAVNEHWVWRMADKFACTFKSAR